MPHRRSPGWAAVVEARTPTAWLGASLRDTETEVAAQARRRSPKDWALSESRAGGQGAEKGAFGAMTTGNEAVGAVAQP